MGTGLNPQEFLRLYIRHARMILERRHKNEEEERIKALAELHNLKLEDVQTIWNEADTSGDT